MTSLIYGAVAPCTNNEQKLDDFHGLMQSAISKSLDTKHTSDRHEVPSVGFASDYRSAEGMLIVEENMIGSVPASRRSERLRQVPYRGAERPKVILPSSVQ